MTWKGIMVFVVSTITFCYGCQLAKSMQDILPNFIDHLVQYSSASGLYIITDELNYCVNLMAVSALKIGVWYKVVSYDHKNMLKVLSEGQDQPRLVLLLLDPFNSSTILQSINKHPSVLNSLTWVAFQRNHDPPYHFQPSPLLRMFLVATSRHKLIVFGKTSPVLDVKFIFWNYETGSTNEHTIGSWHPIRGLRMDRTHRQCCYNLKGYGVKIVYIPFDVPFTNFEFVNNEWKISGIVGDIFMSISKSLGLKHTKVYAQADEIYGDYSSGNNGTGMFRELFYKRADIIVTALLMTEGRRKIADFSYPLMEITYSAIYKKNYGSSIYQAFFLNPFTWQAWILVASLNVAFLIIVTFINEKVKRDQIRPFDIFNFWGEILSQGVTVKSKSLGSLSMHFTFMWLGGLLAMFYSSTLISQKTVQLNTPPFESLGELASNSYYRPLIWNGSAQQTIIKNSKYSEYQALWKRMKTNLPWHTVNNKEELVKALSKGGVAYIGDKLLLYSLRQKDPDLRILEADYMRSGVYIAFQKNSHLTRIFNNVIENLKEQGVIERIKHVYIKKFKARSSSSKKVDPIYFDQTLSMFYLMVVFWTIAINVEIAEFYINRKNSDPL